MRTPEQEKLVFDWITNKVPEYRCTFCGGQAWGIGDVLLVPWATPLLSPGISTPMVPVVCKTCARVDLFSAQMMGLQPPY